MRAYTVKDGLWDSAVSTYIYEFTSEIPVPIGGKLTYNGGELDGVEGIVSIQYFEDEVIKLPKPSREGYIFDYWEGSRYEAGQKYKVTDDHTFTAQWEKDGGGDKDKNKNDSGGANTGDDNIILPWLMILILATIGLISLPISRKRRG